MKRFAMLLAVLTLVVGAAVAQNGAFAPYATAGVGIQSAAVSTVDKTNPNYTVGGGLESSTKYLLLDAHTTFNTANNAVTGQGYTFDTQAAGYLKVFNHFLGGAGVDSTVNSVDLKSKGVNSFQGVHPFVGAGYQTSKFRVIATYLLPGKDAVTNERIGNVNAEVFVTKHIRAIGGILLDSNVPEKTRQMTVGATAGIKIVL